MWKKLDKLAVAFEIEWNWVKGHNGNTYNERCDTLCQEAMTLPELEEDEGYMNALKDSEPASETAIDTKEEPDVKKDSETGKTTEENFDIEDNEESSIEDELDVLEDELPLL